MEEGLHDRPSSSRRVIRATVALGLASLLVPTPVYAYIDPITGSAILQVLAAGVLAAGLMFRTTLSRVTDGLRRLWSRVSRR
jgi:hypothetical protein